MDNPLKKCPSQEGQATPCLIHLRAEQSNCFTFRFLPGKTAALFGSGFPTTSRLPSMTGNENAQSTNENSLTQKNGKTSITSSVTKSCGLALASSMSR